MDIREATRNARALMALHGLDGWSFAMNRNKTNHGKADFSKRTIFLSVWQTEAATPEQVRQIMLHEISHVLAGYAAGHGPRWRAVARSIGYTGGRTAPAVAEVPARWLGTCSGCDRTWKRHRLTKRTKSAGCCSHCRTLLTWVDTSRNVKVG